MKKNKKITIFSISHNNIETISKILQYYNNEISFKNPAFDSLFNEKELLFLGKISKKKNVLFIKKLFFVLDEISKKLQLKFFLSVERPIYPDKKIKILKKNFKKII